MAKPVKRIKVEVPHFEDIFLNSGFYHIGKSLWHDFDIKSLITCRGVSKKWKNFVDSEFPDLVKLKNNYNTVYRRKSEKKYYSHVFRCWKPCFQYFKTNGKLEEFRIFIAFMIDFCDEVLSDYHCWGSRPSDSPLTLAIKRQDFEVLNLFFKAPNSMIYFEYMFQCWHPKDSLNFILEHSDKIDVNNIHPDELLFFVIYYTHSFDELNDFGEELDEEEFNIKHEKLIKNVIGYCDSKHKDFKNQRRTKTKRKDGNTPLHYLQISTSRNGHANCSKLSKTCLRTIFQLYKDHDFDLFAQNDHGKTPWEMEDETLQNHDLFFNGGNDSDFSSLPMHYLEVLIEFGLK